MNTSAPPSPQHSAPPPEGSGLAATFLRVSGRLRHLAAQLLGSEVEADDALYEAFARLWPRRSTLATPAEEEAMLTTTVRHISIDTLRRRTAHPLQELTEAQTADVHSEASDLEEQYQEVQTLIAQHLTPLQQQLLQRREVDGESYAQLAFEFGLQEAALRQQLSRARKTIRSLYLQRHSTP